MHKSATMAAVLATLAIIGCDTNRTGYGNGTAYGNGAASRGYASGPAAVQYGTRVDNSMPGAQGGFNNDDINGKSRNPYTTTPNTGPYNANPVASGTTPR